MAPWRWYSQYSEDQRCNVHASCRDRKVPLIADRPELSELGRYIVEDTMLSLPFPVTGLGRIGTEKPLYAFTSIEEPRYLLVLRRKNFPIMEFNPANKGLPEFGASGFRTFCRRPAKE
jgi:hypothetical protein